MIRRNFIFAIVGALFGANLVKAIRSSAVQEIAPMSVTHEAVRFVMKSEPYYKYSKSDFPDVRDLLL